MLSYLFCFIYNYDYDPDYYDEINKDKKVSIIENYNEDFKNSITNIIKKKYNKIKKLKNVPLNTENILNKLNIDKIKKININIFDYNFEKNITYEIKDPYIFKIENSFSDEECDNMIAQFEREIHHHHNGVTSNGFSPNTKRTTEINLREVSWSKWNNLCSKKLNEAIKLYADHCLKKCHNDYFHSIGSVYDHGYQLQKYMKEHEYFKWHNDGSVNNHEHRVVTFLWYLNDVHEGGETYFFNCKVKPKKGSLVLFPAFWNYNHKGETPISNDKYIITGWLFIKNN